MQVFCKSKWYNKDFAKAGYTVLNNSLKETMFASLSQKLGIDGFGSPSGQERNVPKVNNGVSNES